MIVDSGEPAFRMFSLSQKVVLYALHNLYHGRFRKLLRRDHFRSFLALALRIGISVTPVNDKNRLENQLRSCTLSL